MHISPKAICQRVSKDASEQDWLNNATILTSFTFCDDANLLFQKTSLMKPQQTYSRMLSQIFVELLLLLLDLATDVLISVSHTVLLLPILLLAQRIFLLQPEKNFQLSCSLMLEVGLKFATAIATSAEIVPMTTILTPESIFRRPSVVQRPGRVHRRGHSHGARQPRPRVLIQPDPPVTLSCSCVSRPPAPICSS